MKSGDKLGPYEIQHRPALARMVGSAQPDFTPSSTAPAG